MGTVQEEYFMNYRAHAAGTPRNNEHRPEKPHPPRLWRHATLLAIITLWSILALEGKPHYFSADSDQPRHVTLEGGSTLDLRTGSAVAVESLATECRIVVIQGEVLFNIAHNASRHVDVFAGSTLIRVLGTQFDVWLEHDAVKVIVLDGVVNVSRLERATHSDVKQTSTTLSRGELMEIDSDASQPLSAKAISPNEIKSGVAWNVRHYPYVTVEEIVAELNRYNVQPKINIRDPRLRSARFVGDVAMSDPRAFTEKLRIGDPDILATEAPDGEISLTYGADTPR